MVDYLSGHINEEEYKKRLSSSSGLSSSMSTSNYSLKLQEQQQQQQKPAQHGFGLDFFDSNNSNDVRDASLEKLIGLASQQTQQEKLSSRSETKSSSMFSKKVSISIRSGSSNDTSNDEDDVECSSTTTNSDATLSKCGEEENDTVNNSTDDEDSQALIMSLLSSRQSKIVPMAAGKESNAKTASKEMSFIDMKRQFIQGQLEAVRKQKEKLQIQNVQMNQQQQQQQQTQRAAFSHNVLGSSQVYHMPPPTKVHKLIGSANLHELSTIKEVDTPKSERNLKLNNKNVRIFCVLFTGKPHFNIGY